MPFSPLLKKGFLPNLINVSGLFAKQGVTSEILANPPAANEIVYNSQTSRIQVGTELYAKLSEAGGGADLIINYTGNLLHPIYLVSRFSPAYKVTASGITTFNKLVGIESFTDAEYTEPLGHSGGLASLSFDNLEFINGGLLGSASLAALASLSCPVLKYIKGTLFGAGIFFELASINFPLLEVVGAISMSNSLPIVNFSLPSLKQIRGNLVLNLTDAITVSLPQLEYIGGTSSFVLGTATSLALPSLKYSRSIVISSFNTNVASFSFGSQLKSVAGNFTATGLSLNLNSVNGILVSLASLDGTNGTIVYGNGRMVNLSGGTSSAPSGAGLTAKATLQGRGVTVIHN
jgi:hypothetical protein